MLLPLPTPLVDVLLALDLALAALVLGAVLLGDRPLSLSTFPTLLLVTSARRNSVAVFAVIFGIAARIRCHRIRENP